ncbi:MAG: MqnA/MqnD/SBP family protein, partial [Acidobacteriota bacterium]
SRTSVALLEVLCASYFGIHPEMRPMLPEPERMLRECDAALVIGDLALMFDHAAAGVQKIDLGEAWTAYTSLPFVYAFWVGRAGAITGPDIDLLVRAGQDGVVQADVIARSYFAATPRWIGAGASYLRDHVKFGFGERQRAGLTRFYHEAADLGLVPAFAEPRFY